MNIFNCNYFITRAAASSVCCLALPSLNKVDIYIHTYIRKFSPCFLNFMINWENLIKIGRAGGNTSNQEGWKFWKNKTLWKRIFGNSFSMHLQEGYIQTSKGGWGEG